MVQLLYGTINTNYYVPVSWWIYIKIKYGESAFSENEDALLNATYEKIKKFQKRIKTGEWNIKNFRSSWNKRYVKFQFIKEKKKQY